MSFINKQKFLTELGRLLTFMQEEDKETTLAMYGKMFDLVPNEEMLSSMLVSPTRQAVRLARVYDSAFNSEQAAEEGEDETAPYIACIKEVFNEVLDKMPDQSAEQPEEPEQPGNKSNEQEREIAPGEEGTSPLQTEEPEPVAVPKEETKKEENANQVDDFLKDFKIENNALGDEKEEKSKALPVDSWMEETTEESNELKVTVEDAQPPVSPDEEDGGEAREEEEKPNGKLSGGALALFLIIAIPITAVGIILDIAVALGFLSASAAGFLMAFRVLGAAFGSFKVFADVLVVTGTGFVLGGISFLLFWTAIWLAFHVSVKMVSGIINLAIKLCTKEDGKK